MPRWLKTTTACIGFAAGAGWAGWLATSQLDGPWGMLPGGRLEGPSLPCQAARWEEYTASAEVEVEVRPCSPRSLTTWSVVREGQLFVPADFLTPWKRWPYQVQDDDRIRLRVGGQIFECRAERVHDEALIEELGLEAAKKYDLRPDGRAARIEVWWFRVQPRSPG